MSKADRNRKKRAERQADVAAEPPSDSEAEPVFDGPAWREFAARLNELAVAHSFAARGLPPQGRDLMSFVERAGADPDKSMKITPSLPWDRDEMPSYGEIRQGDIADFLAHNGPVATLVGHLWAVTVFTEWDVTYRKRIADERGIETNEVVIPALGDIRHFRNDIVHHRGVASADLSGKAEVFRNWITVGEPIFIGEKQILAFMDTLGLVDWDDTLHTEEMNQAAALYEAESKRRGGRKDFILRFGDPEK